jgi:hypothetical protein
MFIEGDSVVAPESSRVVYMARGAYGMDAV